MSGADWRMPTHLRIVGASGSYAQECAYCPWRSRAMDPRSEGEQWRATAEAHRCVAVTAARMPPF